MRHFYYDRDLGRVRRGLLLAAGINMGTAAANFVKGNVLVAVTCLIWVVSIGFGVALVRVEQQHRDQMRLLMAASREEQEP